MYFSSKSNILSKKNLSILGTSSSYVVIFLCHFCPADILIKISNLLIWFCSFEFSCPVLEKYHFIEHLSILYCLTK